MWKKAFQAAGTAHVNLETWRVTALGTIWPRSRMCGEKLAVRGRLWSSVFPVLHQKCIRSIGYADLGLPQA